MSDKILAITATLTALNALMAAIPESYVRANNFVTFLRHVIRREPIGTPKDPSPSLPQPSPFVPSDKHLKDKNAQPRKRR
jgi:hypothetical protein